MLKTLLFFCLILLSTFSAQAKKIKITVWSYYLTPPFYMNESEGLATDFVNLLNKLSSRYHFHLSSIPRARLNKQLADKQQGIVLFVNQRWMLKSDNYLWTPAILYDQNDVISPINHKVNYQNSASLTGLIFGAVRGRIFEQFEPLFANGNITRIDVNREEQLMKMLVRKRIDVTSLPRSTMTYLCRNSKIKDQLYFSPSPLYRFSRHIMLTSKLTRLHQDLSTLVQDLPQNINWQTLINKYQLSTRKHQLKGPVLSCFN